MALAIAGGALLAAALLAGFVLPKHAYVGRRVVIEAPSELVWVDLGAPASWPEWAQGASPTVTESDPNKGLKYKWELDGRQAIEGRVQLTRDGTRTAVAWVDSMYFAHDYVGRYWGAAMPWLHGPRLDKSLLALKQRSEERAHQKNVVAVPAPQAHDPALTPPPEEPKGSAPPGEEPKAGPAPSEPLQAAPRAEAPPVEAPAEPQAPKPAPAEPTQAARPAEAPPPAERPDVAGAPPTGEAAGELPGKPAEPAAKPVEEPAGRPAAENATEPSGAAKPAEPSGEPAEPAPQ